MADIIKCSGGEPVNFDSTMSPGDKVIIVSCEADLSMCREALDAGVPVHSTELILGGVLKQELDLESYPENIHYTHLQFSGQTNYGLIVIVG